MATDKKEVKKELQVAAAPAAPANDSPIVDFHAWFAMMEKKIPAHHYKEIILAHFKSKGLSMKEKLSTYNEALKHYGL